MKLPRAALAVLGAAAAFGLVFWSLRGRGDRAAVDACRFAIRAEADRLEARWRERASGAGADPVDVDPESDVLVVCAPLYKESACREAMIATKGFSAVNERYRRIVDVCREAYCPSLPEPRPSLCAAVPKTPREVAAAWAELTDAALRRDLGTGAEPIVSARRDARDRVTSAIAAYFDAGAPAWTGSHGTSIRLQPKDAGGD